MTAASAGDEAATHRSVLLVVHTGREQALSVARELSARLRGAGVTVFALADEHAALASEDIDIAPASTAGDVVDPSVRLEVVVALGGDGTLLRAAEIAHPMGTPLLGVNLGHVGFLAEADVVDLDVTADRILRGDYDIEERLTLSVRVHRGDEVSIDDWALNDMSVEKAARERMLELVLEIDERPLSRWGCDGIVCATPTGSTAYAFSAGGPIVWPSVQALLVVPLSAHALFARPLLVSPHETIAVELTDDAAGAVMFCDGRRTHDLRPRDRLEITRSANPIRLIRLRNAAFTDRLVDKFQLPVEGWRGRGER